MKKLIAKTLIIIMALIVFSACSQNPAPAVSESPAASDISLPTPTPTLTPEPTPTPTPVVLPDYLPPTNFEVGNVWRAEPFGDQGGALIYTSDIADGTFSFKLYMYQYVHEQDSIDPRMNLSTLTAAAKDDGEKYIFSAEQGHSGSVKLDGLIKLDGALSLSEETLTLEYSNAELPKTHEGSAEFEFGEAAPNIRYGSEEWSYGNFTTFLPVTFIRVPEDEAGVAMYDMPLYEDEIVLPFTDRPTPDELKSMLGTPVESVRSDEWAPVSVHNAYEAAYIRMTEFNDQAGNLHYYVWDFLSGDPEVIPEVRRVEIGDDISSVLSSFRCERENYADILSSTLEDGEIVLYGPTSSISQFCKVIF